MRSLLIFLTLLVCLQGAHAQAILLPGEAAYNRGDYAKARKELTAAPGYGTNLALTLMQARIEIAENKLDDAQNLVNSVIEGDSQNALAYSLRGQLLGMQASRASLFRAGSYAKNSLASFEKALELDPKLEEALVGMVRYRLSAPTLFGGSVDKAREVTERLIKVNPLAGNLELANLYAKQGEDALQVELLRKITKDHPQNPRAFLALGFIEQSARNYEQAFEQFAAAVETGGTTTEHTHSVQGARYQMGRSVVLSRSESKDDLENGIAALSDYLDGPWFGDLPDFQWAHYRRGLLYERLGDEAKATGDFTLASKTEDRDLKRALAGR